MTAKEFFETGPSIEQAFEFMAKLEAERNRYKMALSKIAASWEEKRPARYADEIAIDALAFDEDFKDRERFEKHCGE